MTPEVNVVLVTIVSVEPTLSVALASFMVKFVTVIGVLSVTVYVPAASMNALYVSVGSGLRLLGTTPPDQLAADVKLAVPPSQWACVWPAPRLAGQGLRTKPDRGTNKAKGLGLIAGLRE